MEKVQKDLDTMKATHDRGGAAGREPLNQTGSIAGKIGKYREGRRDKDPDYDMSVPLLIYFAINNSSHALRIDREPRINPVRVEEIFEYVDRKFGDEFAVEEKYPEPPKWSDNEPAPWVEGVPTQTLLQDRDRMDEFWEKVGTDEIRDRILILTTTKCWDSGVSGHISVA